MDFDFDGELMYDDFTNELDAYVCETFELDKRIGFCGVPADLVQINYYAIYNVATNGFKLIATISSDKENVEEVLKFHSEYQDSYNSYMALKDSGFIVPLKKEEKENLFEAFKRKVIKDAQGEFSKNNEGKADFYQATKILTGYDYKESFLFAEVGDTVEVVDNSSHELEIFTIRITSKEADADFVTETNPEGIHFYGECLELEKGEISEFDNYITNVNEENFIGFLAKADRENELINDEIDR